MSDDILERIKSDIASSPICVFAKGTADMPRCGFSQRTIAIFKELGKPFKVVDVLPDPRIREVLSAYSEWPTIPQVFIAGNFIGGCDIVTALHENGDLQPLVKAAFAR